MEVKLMAGQYMRPVKITEANDRLWLTFAYHPKLLDEVKSMEGAKWHGYEDPPIKKWSIANSQSNWFQLKYLAHPGINDPENPYAWYNRPLLDVKPTRPENYDHQVDMFRNGMTYRQWIMAADMGVGKTLVLIEIMEASGFTDWIYVGPKSALFAVQIEFMKWKSKVTPTFLTYEALKKLMENWPSRKPAPHGVAFDESSRIKNPTAQRTQAARHLATNMRNEYGQDAFIIEMSGSPAPKSPADWHSQCNIACPGFLREGSIEKFKKRLAIIEERESISGGVFPHLKTWKDDEKKCDICGEYEPVHDFETGHAFKPSINEISYLYKRMKGLVIVKLKKDCFGGDTQILTKDGSKKIKDCLGEQYLYVYTAEGMKWIKSEIKSFGIQDTYSLRFGDGIRVRTTLTHKWLIRPNKKLKNQDMIRKNTYELKIGKDELPLADIVLPEIDWEGYAHGFVFGDGTHYNDDYSKVPLYGHDNDLKPLLLKFGKLGYLKRSQWDCYLDSIHALPRHWKSLPVKPTREYALGFIFGLISADGFVNRHLQIYQANFEDIHEIRELAIFAGLRCQNIRIARLKSPFDNTVKPLYAFTMSTYNITSEMLLRKDQVEKLIIRKRHTSTTLSNLDLESKQTEEVYCAVVPFYQNFTLANGVITGNCLQLPDKIYREIQLKPTQSILNAAKLITAKSSSTIQALTLLRELSDGFQYQETETGESVTCPRCNGSKIILEYHEDNEPTETVCTHCSGTGEILSKNHEAIQVPCPKEDALRDLLDEHVEIGRLVTFAGFTGSVDRCVQISKRVQWEVIRVDGRGWHSSFGCTDPKEMLTIFQDKNSKFPRINFIGQASSAGMGLTLTASPSIVYYSNDFNAESRIQSEDRGHRPGMDLIRGCTIIDLLHLPTDLLILNNLKRKRRLQDMSLGQFQEAIAEIKYSDVRAL